MFFFLRRPSFSYFILIGLVLAGVYAVTVIGKESTPELKIPIVLVQTTLPGASALDVEGLVTDVIEDQLKRSVDDVQSITSESLPSASIIKVEFDDSVDIATAKQSVKDEVDLVLSDLPSDAFDPVIREISFTDSPVFVMSMSTKSAFTVLSELVQDIEDMLLDVRGVSEVSIAGLPEREVNVVLQQADLSELNLNVTSVLQGLQGADIALPIGSIVQNGLEYNISFNGDITSAGELADLVVARTQSGSPVYLGDIARVEDGLEAYETKSRLSEQGSQPQQAVTFSVKKQVGYDVTLLAADLRAAVAEVEAEYQDADVSFRVLADDGEKVSQDLLNLTASVMQSIALVFLVLLVGLGMRPAILAAISVPLSFTVAFIGLLYSGSTLNFISLFALVLVVGMLVDAAVVITEGMTNEIEKGKTGMEAAKRTLVEFFGSIVAGTATTLAVFAPMLMVSGITGQIIAPIPTTVIIVLLGSLFVALAFVPLIGLSVLKPDSMKIRPGSFAARRDAMIASVTAWYRTRLAAIITNRRLSNGIIAGMIGLLLLSFSLVGFGLLKIEFFPADDFDQLTLDVTFPAGGILADAEQQLVGVEDILLQTEHIESFVTNIEADSAEVIIELESKKVGAAVLARLRDSFAAYTDLRVIVVPPASGGSSGPPFAVKFVGENLGDLRRVADEAAQLIATIPGTADVSSSVDANSIDIELTADRVAIEEVGLSVAAVAQIARASLFGVDATSFRHPKSDESVDVVVKVSLNPMAFGAHVTNHINIDTLRNLPIQTQKGEVLLGSLVEADIIEAAARVDHEDGERTVSVSSYVEDGFVVGDVNTAFLAAVAADELQLPEGVELQFGGDTEDSATSMKELGMSLLVGLALIVSVLIFQFNSVQKMFFIVSVIPFGLVGVLLGLFMFGQTLSFTAMIGFIALVGIVINNSIILIDTMTMLGKDTDDHTEVVLAGAASRLRPILLTTATTVIGMIPLLFTSPMWTPLALAVITGLLFAVVLTLVLIPIFYYRWGTSTASASNAEL